MQPDFLDRLNEAQRAAATHVEGPLLVLAGPGSGKTRVVTSRIAHLIAAGVPAAEIVALTFTNKAADEMRRRVAELVGPSRSRWEPFIGSRPGCCGGWPDRSA